MFSKIGLLVFGLSYLFHNKVHAASISPRAPDETYVMNVGEFDFHSSCNDPNPANHRETKQEAIVRGWAGALEMAANSKARFERTKTTLTKNNPPSSADKRSVESNDPAYVQYFKNDYTADVLTRVGNIWGKMVGSMNVPAGEGKRPSTASGGQYLIACQSVHNAYKQGDKCQIYGDSTFAITRNMVDGNGNYQASSTNFCDRFFNQPRFDRRKFAVGPDAIPTENIELDEWEDSSALREGYSGTEANTILHEWTHLWWIGPTNPASKNENGVLVYNPPEVYGWYECAKLTASEAKEDVITKSWSNNADNYSWYAEYGSFTTFIRSDYWPSIGKFKKTSFGDMNGEYYNSRGWRMMADFRMSL